MQVFLTYLAKTVKVPSMGDSITEGAVFELSKSNLLTVEVGDAVEIDEIVAVIETDKVKVDIRSPEKGVITKFHAALGETVEVNLIFLKLIAYLI